MQSQNSEIPIRQSTTERKPILHTPVLFKIVERRMTIVTVPRLHFSETTLNNQRKNLRPNPDQKYFNLVVRLYATATDGTTVLMQAFASERVIVRVSIFVESVVRNNVMQKTIVLIICGAVSYRQMNTA